MATLKLTSSGGGVQSIDTPSTASSFTSTLPGTTGTLLDTNSSLPAANLTGTVADARISALTASKLTGALPAISGASLTGISSGGLFHLGTLTTTSGTSQSITINLSLYNQIWINTNNVGTSGSTSRLQFSLNGDALADMTGDNPAANGMWAAFKFDLRTNSYVTPWQSKTAATSGSSVSFDLPTLQAYYNLGTNYRALTSAALVLGHSGQTFDSGSAEVYGLK